jgi:NAD(P)-dependent dehydrogenase (short-subunit alcohol dehydrogenase family)
VITLDNKKVLVSGSSQGLGRKIVEKFSENNAFGFGFDLQESNKHLKGWEFLPVNVSDEQDIINGFNQIKKKFGKLDVVVANAGIVPPWRTINEIDNDEWEEVFNVNVKGVALTIKHSVELMKSSGGSIIVMGSINSLIGHSGQSLYTASKHALLGIVKCAAIDLGKYNIRVNVIGPGPIATEALLKRLKSREDNKGMSVKSALEGFANNTALGRMPTEDDVANTALYLSSNLSSSITGQIIPVSSGLIRLE